MQPLLLLNTEPAANGRRVAALAEMLAAGLGSPPTDAMYESCSDLDQAVEFAALEGVSAAEAIAAFFDERPASGWPLEHTQMAHLTGYGLPPIDIAALPLPVMPKQVSRLFRTSNEVTSAVELEKIAGSDPVLSGKLVGASNSALFGCQYRIVRLLEAIIFLGIPEARKVLLAACFEGLFASKPLQDLWKHSQAVATAAGGLAQLVDVDPDTAYLAGLLHDIGRLAFVKSPAKARIREQEWLAAGLPVAYAETLAYGMDHAELGARLLRAWELPDAIVEAVRLHHRPECGGSLLSAVLNLAEYQAASAENQDSEDLWDTMRRSAACVKAGITPEQLGEFQVRNSPLRRTYA